MNKKLLSIALTITCLYNINTAESAKKHQGQRWQNASTMQAKMPQEMNMYNAKMQGNMPDQNQYPQSNEQVNIQYQNNPGQKYYQQDPNAMQVNNRQQQVPQNINDNNQQIQSNNNDVPYTSIREAKPSKPKQNYQIENQSFSYNNIVMDSDTALGKLYNNNTWGMFKDRKDMSRYSENALRVDFQLTMALCEAIKSKSVAKIKNIILTDNKKCLGEYEDIFEQCIITMLNNFNAHNDLEFLMNYLAMTNGNATYTPVSSMKNWLQSLEFFEDIKDIAKPFLEGKDDSKPIKSKELRISFYFVKNNKSWIDIPKADQLSLLTNLVQIKNALQQTSNNKVKEIAGNAISQAKEKLAAIKIQEELGVLNDNEDIKTLKVLKYTKTQKENEFLKVPRENKQKKEEAEKQAQAKLEEYTKNRNQQQITSTNQNITNIQKDIQKLNNQINNLIKQHIEPIDKQIAEIENKCKDINKQIEDKQEKLKQLPQVTNKEKNALIYINEKYDREILNLLNKAYQVLSNSNNTSINNNIPVNNNNKNLQVQNFAPVMTNVSTNVTGG